MSTFKWRCLQYFLFCMGFQRGNGLSFAGRFSNVACAGFQRGLAAVWHVPQLTTTTECTRRLQTIAAVHQHQFLKCSCVILFVQQDRDKLKPIITCHTSTYQFLRPCLLVITWLLFVKRCATHTSTPSVYVYAPSPYSTADATAAELGRRRRSRPLTCSNSSGNFPRVWYPPTAAEGWWHKSCSGCRKHRSLCTLCGLQHSMYT